MGRLIDADWLIKELGDINMDIYTDEVKDYINEAPTIEVPTWIPFEIRPTDDEEREYFQSEAILDGALPDEGDEILVSRGKWVWQDTFLRDEYGAWLDSYGEIEDGMAWMPLPKPYEETNHD